MIMGGINVINFGVVNCHLIFILFTVGNMVRDEV